ncbi:tubby-like F-box protein 5 isoform X2 [Salvia miltiorrhiza]|nr:tubby-like F-box protein 5 isoform X2 [Salvia miltiorrhiza]
MSLKQPGPRDSQIQCFIRRERATSTYRLYLGLSPAISGDASKLLLAAKKIKRATKIDFVISFAAKDFSHTSDNYAGKLRFNFFGSKFYIHDSQPPWCNTLIQSHGWSWKRISAEKVAPRIPICNFNVATIAYELNVLRTRGPRRMQCTMHMIPVSSTQKGGSAPTPATFSYGLDETFSPLTASEVRKEDSASDVPIRGKSKQLNSSIDEPLILKNKTPRWHEQLQCWCLNFRGRVTVASVKNFQLVAVGDPSENAPAPEQEKVILQFGKIGKDIFTMDYRYPLSVFQAFALCLSNFDTKPVCE